MNSLTFRKSKLSSVLFDAVVVLFTALTIQFLYMCSGPAAATSAGFPALTAAFYLLDTSSLLIPALDFRPGYSLFVAGALAAGGRQAVSVILAQHVLIALLASAATVVVGHYSKRSFGLCAGMLIALDPVLAFSANWLAPDLLFVCCASFGAFGAFEMHRSPVLSAFSGFLFGGAALLNQGGVALGLATLLLVFAASINRRGDLRHTAAAMLLFALSFMLPVAPWMLYQHQAEPTAAEDEGAEAQQPTLLTEPYWTRFFTSFANLLHLTSESAELLRLADAALADTPEAKDPADSRESSFVKAYAPRNRLTETWRLLIHDIYTVKALCSSFLLFLAIVSVYALIRGSLFDPILLLPYVLFISYAAQQAWQLSGDERATIVFSPLLYVQLGLLLGSLEQLARIRR